MRKLLLAAAFVIASASAQAQTIDVGSILSANGISIGKSGGQPQAASQQGAADGMAQGAGGQGAAGQGQGQGQGQSQRQTGRARQPRESAQETRARNIAAKYGISW
ncbi:hypothetical protein [Bradyrhizobium sp. SZCCHNRI1058]|uniref:hypothetical protein n=1 Tax=Bradyrhizobium sp. SZCCHNRI1058 TaxID=3057279 RepID=UPI00291657BB|nr:hypothetical protein [Bradyrhizobium sp. SZCCHNRI1058]